MDVNDLAANTRRLANARINAGRLSVKLLAAQTGISTSHISLWRNRKRSLSVRSLSAILKALGMTVDAQMLR
jgi:transcriptional regulator with XRE-family HTH domain